MQLDDRLRLLDRDYLTHLRAIDLRQLPPFPEAAGNVSGWGIAYRTSRGDTVWVAIQPDNFERAAAVDWIWIQQPNCWWLLGQEIIRHTLDGNVQLEFCWTFSPDDHFYYLKSIGCYQHERLVVAYEYSAGRLYRAFQPPAGLRPEPPGVLRPKMTLFGYEIIMFISFERRHQELLELSEIRTLFAVGRSLNSTSAG